MNDLYKRMVCTNGNCVGTINAKGYCNICGKSPADIDLGKEALGKIVKFPILPTLTIRKKYQSVFLPLMLKTKLAGQVHLEDLSLFFSSIQHAAHYRLTDRISNSLVYPVTQPTFPVFPCGAILNPRQLPLKPQKPKLKWYDYLLIWRMDKRMAAFNQDVKKFEQQKRKGEEVNKWLSEVYCPQKELFNKTCQVVMEDWKEAKSQWEGEANQERASLEELRAQYEVGNPRAIVEYFRAQLNSVPLPIWCPREYDLQFDEDDGILLIDVRLPYFGALEVMKTR